MNRRTLILSLALTLLGGEVSAQGLITADTHFYGQSPPVYPSRELTMSNAITDMLR
jgi:hypothetical protein